MWRLARLIYSGKIVEKSGLLYSFNEQTLFDFFSKVIKYTKKIFSIVANDDGKLKKEQSEKLKAELKNLSAEFAKIEIQMTDLKSES